MAYGYTLLSIIWILFSIYLGLEIGRFIAKRRSYYKLKKLPFPKNYEQIVKQLYFYNRLTPKEQQEVRFLIMRFIYEKEIVGVQGMIVNDEVKVIIAFYACLLLLNIKHHDLYGNLERVLVYPYEFILKEIKSFGGIYTQGHSILEGQSMNDTVVLSWHNIKNDLHKHSYNNVIIHEFAHELDFLDGEIDGVPPMDAIHFASWAKRLFSTFHHLNDKSLKGRFLGKYKLFGSYAATNEAEFFAVATERFFQTPHSLQKKFPKVYAELKNFYKIDTLSRLDQSS